MAQAKIICNSAKKGLHTSHFHNHKLAANPKSLPSNHLRHSSTFRSLVESQELPNCRLAGFPAAPRFVAWQESQAHSCSKPCRNRRIGSSPPLAASLLVPRHLAIGNTAIPQGSNFQESKLKLLWTLVTRKLRCRWELRKSIDPISLDDIDFANEWLPGIPDDGNEEFVFNDGDDLTWGEIAKFVSVDDTPYSLRSASKGKGKVGSSKGKGKVETYKLVDEDEDEEDDEAYEDGPVLFRDLCDEKSKETDPPSSENDD